MDYAKLITSVLVFYLIVESVVESCTCVPMTERKKYCASDITIKGRVKAKKYFPGNPFDERLRYKVRVLDFKGDVKKTINVFTADNTAACGIDWLVKNHVYVFTLKKVTNSKYKIHLCSSWVEEWLRLKDAEILGINKYWLCFITPGPIDDIVFAPGK